MLPPQQTATASFRVALPGFVVVYTYCVTGRT
jgi:hypothetical protein